MALGTLLTKSGKFWPNRRRDSVWKVLAVFDFSVMALVVSSRYIHCRVSATDMDQSRAHSEAMDQAKDNIQNACPSGGLIPAPQVTQDECHPAGPGAVTCVVLVSGTCED
jgi:hypothetical protein